MASGTKKFWESKTFWVNVIGALAIVIQSQTGYVMGPEAQASILSLVNVMLRFEPNKKTVTA